MSQINKMILIKMKMKILMKNNKIKVEKNKKIDRMIIIINKVHVKMKVIKINRTIKTKFQMYWTHQKVKINRINYKKKRSND